MHGCSWHQVYKERKMTTGVFWARPTFSKRKILAHTSLLYSTFELLNPCHHTAKGPHCAETGLQVVKIATKQKPFDLYRLATGLDRVVENANKLQKKFHKCCRTVADLSRNTEFLFCLFFFQFIVDPA
jgi:hypothetical protein